MKRTAAALVPGLLWAVAFSWHVAGMAGNSSRAACVQCNEPSWGSHLTRGDLAHATLLYWCVFPDQPVKRCAGGRMALYGSAGITASASPHLSQRAFCSSLLRWSMLPACLWLCSLPDMSLAPPKSCSYLWFRSFLPCRHPLQQWGASCMSNICNLPVLEFLQKWVTCGT